MKMRIVCIVTNEDEKKCYHKSCHKIIVKISLLLIHDDTIQT